MSSEVYELVKKLSLNNLNTQTAMQCAPLIAGLKASNLMSIDRKYYRQLRNMLKGSGISCYVLVMTDTRITMLMYNVSRLGRRLEDARTIRFMKELGYSGCSLDEILPVFKTRYRRFISDNRDFPHEMGVLLDYPIEDVEGFIRNRGQNFLYTGYWKVYDKPQEKMQLFARFEHARERFVQLLSYGMRIGEIITICGNAEARELLLNSDCRLAS